MNERARLYMEYIKKAPEIAVIIERLEADSAALRAEVERKDRELGYICLGWNDKVDKLAARLVLADKLAEAARKIPKTGRPYRLDDDGCREGLEELLGNIAALDAALLAYDAGREAK